MNKQELIQKIAKDTDVTKVKAAAAVDSFLDGITRSLKKGEAITFVGFGTFKTSQRKARIARNPQTGAEIKVPKRRVVRFTAGKALKNAVPGPADRARAGHPTIPVPARLFVDSSSARLLYCLLLSASVLTA
jgi:DNA-binding protein HU-beta